MFDSVEANGPDYEIVPKGRFTAGLTEAESSYEYEFLDTGDYCEVRSVDINLGLIVTLPEHSNTLALSDLLLSRWQGFKNGVAVHEQKHVDIHIERIEAFKKRLESFPEKFPDCETLKSNVTSAWELERILDGQEQEAFHESEEQLSQRLRTPVQQQIDDNALASAAYQDELTRIALEIEGLKVQVADFDELMLPYDAEMTAIRDQYPDLVLPPDTFDRYEVLLAERNRLNDLRNAVVTHQNTLAQEHNRIIEEINQLTEQTNQLIEELAWLP